MWFKGLCTVTQLFIISLVFLVKQKAPWESYIPFYPTVYPEECSVNTCCINKSSEKLVLWLTFYHITFLWLQLFNFTSLELSFLKGHTKALSKLKKRNHFCHMFDSMKEKERQSHEGNSIKHASSWSSNNSTIVLHRRQKPPCSIVCFYSALPPRPSSAFTPLSCSTHSQNVNCH